MLDIMCVCKGKMVTEKERENHVFLDIIIINGSENH